MDATKAEQNSPVFLQKLRDFSPPPWLRKGLSALIAVIALAAAGWVLWSRLHDLTWAEVSDAATGTPPLRLALAAACAFGTYAALAAMEVMAVRVVGASVPPARAVGTSFVAQSLAHTVGFGSLIAPALRWRLYHGFGMDAVCVGKVVLFTLWIYVLGALPLTAYALVVERSQITALSGIPEGVLLALAALCATAFVAYLGFAWNRKPIKLWKWRLDTLGPKATALQVGLGVFNIACVAGIFWFLMPAGTISFANFVALHMLTVAGGVITHVPGGIGVFEAMMLVFFSDQPEAVVMGAALVYRLLYNLIPLVLALIVFAALELRRRAG